jgi:hypothetical protein
VHLFGSFYAKNTRLARIIERIDLQERTFVNISFILDVGKGIFGAGHLGITLATGGFFDS